MNHKKAIHRCEELVYSGEAEKLNSYTYRSIAGKIFKVKLRGTDFSFIYGTIIEFDADYLLVIQADENLISGQIGYRHIELINVRMA